MNGIGKDIQDLIGQPESEQLEYKAVLPPSRSIAKIISSFANTNGGFIVLGVAELNGKIEVVGLSEDFNATGIVDKAINIMSPKPEVVHKYIAHNGKRLYVIKVDKANEQITVDGKLHIRKGDRSIIQESSQIEHRAKRFPRLEQFSEKLTQIQAAATEAKSKYIDHYKSVLNIIDDLSRILYPSSPSQPTENLEGKILTRILFSSCADNFESYLSDLLYEIYLANPSSLKSNQQITIKEVLSCEDMQEFVIYWAKKKLGKLQRGSVKGFISDNKQISDLNIINEEQQNEIEKLLQIRHLYAHKNGRVDEKFLQYYPGEFAVNEEHKLTIEELLTKLEYLVDVVDQIDQAAISKYSLATMD
ncbi:MAG: transcriptional regulator [Flavobacteriales bacterium]|nr:transcriptional regulator [Flavobacteriales bacterium]|tara:strand:+ start:16889 stop:17971 length:1083 start_codon:yes stop_codon:yes gene_type:complete